MKRLLIGVAMAALVAAGLAVRLRPVAAPRPKAPAARLAVGMLKSESSSLTYLASDKGFSQAEGLDVALGEYDAGLFALDDLLAGKLDIALAADFAFVRKSFDRPDLRVLAVVNTGDIHEVIALRDRGIGKPADLRGKRVGVTLQTSGEFFLGLFLTSNGLRFGDIQVVGLKPAEFEDALRIGKIDAVCTWDPHAYNLKKLLGESAVSWGAQGGRDVYFLAITREAVLREKPEAIKRFLAALVRAEDYVKASGAEAQRLVRTRLGYDPARMDRAWRKQRFPVDLPQELILVMEEEARWAIRSRLTDQKEVPNYLNYLELGRLGAVRPAAVTVIR